MHDLTAYLHLTIPRDLRTFQQEIELFPSDDAVWQTLPGVTNPAGTLALHVCGNLRHYLGAVLGGSGYVRDREAEFRLRGIPRHELVENLRGTEEVVARVLQSLTPESLLKPYPEPMYGEALRTDWFLLHLGTHLAFHLGQAGYLRRMVTGDGTSTNPIRPQVLAMDR
ncbi:MAG TPA: DinB family protein [Thermoanaerobaculia bacterium]